MIDWYPGDSFIVAMVVIIALGDVALVVKRTPTVSRRLRAYGYRLSFFPYAWGVLGGHFWGPHLEPAFGSWWVSIGLLIFSGLLVSFGHHFMRTYMDPPDWTPLLYVPMGIPAGVFLWPQ